MPTDRRYVLNFVLWSAGYILLGLFLLLAPEHSRLLICYLLGVGAVALGLLRIIWYFAKDDVSRAFHNDIPAGVVLVILGIYLFARPEAVYSWLPVLLGFAIVFDSIIKLQHAFDLKRTGFGPWWWILAAALATALLGVLLIVNVVGKSIFVIYFGTVLIADGVINLITILLLIFQKRKWDRAQHQPEDAEEK